MSNELLDNIIDLALKAGLGSVLTAIVFALGKPEKVRAFVLGWAGLREFAHQCLFRRRGRMMYFRAGGSVPCCGECLQYGRGRQPLAKQSLRGGIGSILVCPQCDGKCDHRGWVIEDANW